MENKNLGDTGEYTFISEKIINKRKKRIKRILLYTVFVLFLAVLFGFVARLAFLKSNTLICSIFGIEIEEEEKEDRGKVKLSEGKTEDGVPEGDSSAVMTPVPADVEKNPENNNGNEEQPGEPGAEQEDGGEDNAEPGESKELTDGVTDDGQGTAPEDGGNAETTPTPEPTPVIVQERVVANINDYVTMMADMRKLATQVNTSLVKVTTYTSGVNWMSEKIEVAEDITGVVMGKDNISMLILVSYDKVKSVDRIEVRFSNIAIVDAELYSCDSDYNLAVIAVPLKEIPDTVKESCPPAVLGESLVLYTGMPIMALGSPNGYFGSLEYGFVTSKGSTIYVTDNKIELFNTDITDNEDSDGIIINMKGQLIGLITHTLKENKNENISTAIGVTKLKPIILKLLNNEDRTYFGIKGEDLPDSVLQERNLENGIYITEVISGSPAQTAGLRKGDIITTVAGARITSMDDFGAGISSRSVDETLKVTYYRRSGEELVEKETEVTLAVKPVQGGNQ